MLPKSMREEAHDLPSSGSMYREYIRMALPSVAEMVLITLINMMDTVMVSGIGTDAVAAVGLVSQPRMIMLCVFFALDVGITAVVARRKGENRPEEANAAVRSSMILILIFSAVLMAVLMPLAVPLMRFAGAEEGRTLQDSVNYFLILGAALPFQAISLALCSAQRGVGNTRLTMEVNITSNLVNIFFNWLLINGVGPFPRLGVVGAAIATDIGLFVGFVLSVLSMVVVKKDSFLHLRLRDSWKPDRQAVASVMTITKSSMVEQLAMRVGFFAYAKIVAGLGTDAFAAHQICNQFLNLSFSIADGFGVAGTSLVGQKLGEGRRDLAHIYGTLAQHFSLMMGLLVAALCIFGRRLLVDMFISNDATGAVERMAMSAMIIVGLIQPPQMLSVVASGALRGAGDVRYTARVMLITVTLIRPTLAILGIYYFNNVLGQPESALVAAWCATVCDMAVRMFLMMRRYKSGRWHSLKV